MARRRQEPEKTGALPEPDDLAKLALIPMPDGLAECQKAFALAYVLCAWTGTTAAVLAGYGHRSPGSPLKNEILCRSAK